tara:strand:- start:96539 stop:98323 length:1785 start_codon:yes stop_codon:yes gene_type:complete
MEYKFKYIIKLENSYELDRDKKLWKADKLFVKKDMATPIDKTYKDMSKLSKEIEELEKIRRSAEKSLKDKKERYRKKEHAQKLAVKNAKRNTNVKPKEGQILHISQMNVFNYNWDGTDKRTKYKWFKELGNVYSDIVIGEVGEKTLLIKYMGRNGNDWDQSIELEEITKRMRLTTFRLFYFKLITSEEYKEVMEMQFRKKINENWEAITDIQKRFLDKDMVQGIEDKKQEIEELEKNIVDSKALLIRKKGELKSHILKTKRSTGNINIKVGQILYIEEMESFDKNKSWGSFFNGINDRINSNLEIMKINPKSIVVRYTGREYDRELREYVDIEKTRRIKLEMFKQFYVELMVDPEYMNVMSTKYIQKINEKINHKIMESLDDDIKYHKTKWDQEKVFLKRDLVNDVDNIGNEMSGMSDESEKSYAEIERLKNRIKELNKKYNLRFKAWQKAIIKAQRGISVSFKVGQILHISQMYSFNYKKVWNYVPGGYDEVEKKTGLRTGLGIGTSQQNDYKGVGIHKLGYVRSDIEIVKVTPKMVVIRYLGDHFTSHTEYVTKVGDKRMLATTFKEIYFNLMLNKEYKEVMENNYLKKINK